MKSFKIIAATVIATSLLGTSARAADAITTDNTGASTPIAKTDVKSDVKTPVKSTKHAHHKKAAVKSDSKVDAGKSDTSVKSDTGITTK